MRFIIEMMTTVTLNTNNDHEFLHYRPKVLSLLYVPRDFPFRNSIHSLYFFGFYGYKNKPLLFPNAA